MQAPRRVFPAPLSLLQNPIASWGRAGGEVGAGPGWVARRRGWGLLWKVPGPPGSVLQSPSLPPPDQLGCQCYFKMLPTPPSFLAVSGAHFLIGSQSSPSGWGKDRFACWGVSLPAPGAQPPIWASLPLPQTRTGHIMCRSPFKMKVRGPSFKHD